MRCPRCRTDLEAREEGYGGWFAIDVCARCTGMLLEPGELDAMDYSIWTNAETLPRVPAFDDQVRGTAGYRDSAIAVDDEEPNPPIDCPRCSAGEPMRMGRFVLDDDAAIELDACDRCHAIWLTEEMLGRIRDLVGSIDSGVVLGLNWKPGTSVHDATGEKRKGGPPRR